MAVMVEDGMWAELLRLLRGAPAACGQVVVIAIDGGAGAGKTTLAARLADQLGPDTATVHTDDLLDGWGDQFGFHDRLRSQVLAPLAAGHIATVPRYDWALGSFGPGSTLPPPRVLLIEGVSAAEAVGSGGSAWLYLAVARRERERRWRARDAGLVPEAEAWLDAEDTYTAAHDLPDSLLRTRPGMTPAGYRAAERTIDVTGDITGGVTGDAVRDLPHPPGRLLARVRRA